MPHRLLFICTGNSARSIMAEAILNHLGRGKYVAQSAGAKPSGIVNPLTIETLRAYGIDTAGLHSKSLTQFLDQDFDTVITVCDNARQSCPIWPGRTRMLHWSIDDPSEFRGTDDEKKAFFERIYRDIEGRISALIASP
jgi:arsenate reductase